MPAPPPPEQRPPRAARGSRRRSVVIGTASIGLIVGIVASSLGAPAHTALATVPVRPVHFNQHLQSELFLATSTTTERHPDLSRRVAEPAATQLPREAVPGRTIHTGLDNIDVVPVQIVDAAPESNRASHDPLLLGAVGAMLTLLAGLALVLSRARRRSTTIGGAKDITSIGDHLVLDGTQDAHRSDTWGIAACMLHLPDDLRSQSFVIMLDAKDVPRADSTLGQELLEALSRQGRAAQLVDTTRINEGKIYRGWPRATNRSSWTGTITVLDTSALSSDALRIALAARADSVVLARRTNDDVLALRRLTALMQRRGAAVDLTVLFPPRRRRFRP